MSASLAGTVNTKHVTDRRTLRFSTPDEAIADARALVAAELAGTLRRTGNWTLGQTFTHIAAFLNYPFDGYPPELRPPWFVKLGMKFMKRRFLYKGLPSGFRIPGIAAGTVGMENVPSAEGLARLEKAWARMKAGKPSRPNPIFGDISHEEWLAINLRHAELHQGFAHPR